LLVTALSSCPVQRYFFVSKTPYSMYVKMYGSPLNVSNARNTVGCVRSVVHVQFNTIERRKGHTVTTPPERVTKRRGHLWPVFCTNGRCTTVCACAVFEWVYEHSLE
jgi:hypothetical protein